MTALPLLSQSEGLYLPIRPQPQRPTPPVQTELDVAGPAEFVTCDQTIERRIAFHKVGRHVRIAEADLINFVAAGRIEPSR
jgi:hypothetical protein